jgi:hypothetical protein
VSKLKGSILGMRYQLGVFLGFTAVLAGCGATDHDEPKALAGASAAPASATGGVTSGGAAAVGGSSSGSAGMLPNGGAAASGASSGASPTRADVDLTLGGFNQDLAPTPSNCDERGVLGCISVSGELGGQRFSATCQSTDGISGTGLGRTQLHCSPDVIGNDFKGFVLSIFLDDFLGQPTRLFSYESPEGQVPTDGQSMALFWTEPTGFSSYDPLEPTPTTHDEVIKIAGLNYEEPYLSDTKQSKFVFGAFAATWTPQPSCVDCPLVRVYARFDVVYDL